MAAQSRIDDKYPSHEPLISRCTNAWRDEEKSHTFQSAQHEQCESPQNLEELVFRVGALLRTPKVQRLVIALLLTAAISLVCWRNFLSATVYENAAVWRSFHTRPGQGDAQVFGSNQRVQFSGVTQLQVLDANHLPRTSSSDKTVDARKRLIFIGDIHGCVDELKKLLEKANYNPEHDHIVSTGDMINKGPDSKGVVRFLMEHGASCVRGNHEDRILLLAKDKRWTQAETEDESEIADKDHRERALARSLSADEIEWLNSCPVILQVGNLPKMGNVVVVHGGLVPGISLLDQDPFSVMNMRSIDLMSHMPSKQHSRHGSLPWYSFWNKYQHLLPVAQSISSDVQSQPMTVIYGHDSKKGLQIHRWTKGLDSGCVNGEKLTALIVGGLGHQQIVQVSSAQK